MAHARSFCTPAPWRLIAVALLLLVAPRSLSAAVQLPPAVRQDGRNPAPRPDLVAISSLPKAPLLVDLRRGAERWTVSIAPLHAEQAVRQAFAEAVVRFDPPLPLRVAVQALRVEPLQDRLQLRLVVRVQDGRDGAPLYQGPGDSVVELRDLTSQAQLHAALLAAIDEAARHCAVQFSARSGAPEQTQSASRLWLGAQLGGLAVMGTSLLWPLQPQWLAQVAANPIGPRVSLSAAAGRRLHGDDAAELRAWLGLTAELPFALVQFCDTSCSFNRVTRYHSAWLLEFAWVFGERLNRRFGLQAGMLVGVELPQWNDSIQPFVSPWGGAGFWSGW